MASRNLQPPPPSSHYVTQAGLSAAFLRVLAALWPRWTSGDIDRSAFRLQLYSLVTQFANASASLAADDYAQRRAAAGIRSSFTVPHAAPPSVDQFNSALNWSLSVVEEDPAAARKNLEGSMGRLVIQPGRETTVGAVQEDRRARAWARETRGDCCSFCAMLATRGAVYKSDQTAGREANARFVGEGEFKYHNHCHCVAVPVFGTYEKPAHARAWTRQWHDLRRELGYSPSLTQWRQFFEGRPVDGLSEPATT